MHVACSYLLEEIVTLSYRVSITFTTTRVVRAIQFFHKAPPAFVTFLVILLVSTQIFLHFELSVMTHDHASTWCCQLCILVSWKALVFSIFNWVAWVFLFLPFWRLFLYSLNAKLLLPEVCRYSHNPQVAFPIPNKIISHKISQIVRNPFWGSSAWSQPKNLLGLHPEGFILLFSGIFILLCLTIKSMVYLNWSL